MSLVRWLFGLSTVVLTLVSMASPASMATMKSYSLLLGVKQWRDKILWGWHLNLVVTPLLVHRCWYSGVVHIPASWNVQTDLGLRWELPGDF